MSEIDMGQSRAELAEGVQRLRTRLVELSQGDLLERVKFLQCVIDAIPTPIYYKDRQGRYVGCNSAFARGVLGRPKSEILGRTCLDLGGALATDLADACGRMEAELMASGGAKVYETAFRFADGAWHDVLVNAAVLKPDGTTADAHREPAGVVGVLLDLNDARKHEAKREIELEGAERAAERAAERTAMEGARRLATRLQTAAEISRSATSQLNPDQLLTESVELIRSRFDLYYVGIFLLDEQDEWAVLRAGSGEAGRRMLADQHRLRFGSDSMIGQCVATAEARIAQNVAHAGARFANPVLPETQSEMALPLVSRNTVIGAMTIQSAVADAFTDEDIVVLQTMADQLANAITNAQLYELAQENLEELRRLQRRYAMDMWDEYLDRQDIVGYSYDLNEVTPLVAPESPDALVPPRVYGPQTLDAGSDEIGDASTRGGTSTHGGTRTHGGTSDGDAGVAEVPAGAQAASTLTGIGQALMPSEGGDGATLRQTLQISGQPVGLLSFEEPTAEVAWSEDQVTVLDAVREQLELALENRLLIDRSQRALREAQQREAELGFLQEVSALLNATNDVVAIQGELFEQFQVFLPLNGLSLVGYDEDTTEITWLGGVGLRAPENDGSAGGRRGGDSAVGLTESGFEWVIRHAQDGTGQSLPVNNTGPVSNTGVVEDDLRMGSRFPEADGLLESGVVSRVILPLRLGYRTLGALALTSGEAAAFDRPGLMPILQQVASQMASAMERGNLLRVAQSNAEESRRLYEVTSDLAEAVDAADILEAIDRHAFPYAFARSEIGLFVFDPETNEAQSWLEIVAKHHSVDGVSLWSSGDDLEIGDRLRASEMRSLNLLGQESVVLCEDTAHDPRLTPEMRAAYVADGVGSFIVMALSTGGSASAGERSARSERFGVLRVRFPDPNSISEDDLRLYRTISEQAAVVLSNRQLFQESQSRIERQAGAVELANLTTSLSEREALLQTSVEFLKDRFGLYFAGIFLNDDLGQWAVLQAGSGDVGERLMLMGHRVQVTGDTMIGRCIRSRSRVMSLDIDAQTAMMENPLLPDTKSAVAFPLISRGQTNGVITLQSTRRFAFTQEDLATLELMVNQLANVIESTNLYERSQASLAETRMLYRIAQQITDARDAEAVLRAAVDGMAQRTEPDWVIAGLMEPREKPTHLRIAVSWSRDHQAFPVDGFALDEIQQLYEVLRADERFVTPNITQDPMASERLRRIYSNLGLRATAAFQLSVRGQQYGTIMVHSQNAREFSTAELSFYENVARQAFVALENISLVEATRAQAERRDILNEVLQTASSSLDRGRILEDVSQVIARRLDMPVMVWEWAGKQTWDGNQAVLVAVHDAGGVQPQAVPLPGRDNGGGKQDRVAGRADGGAPHWGTARTMGDATQAIMKAITQRTPVAVSFEDAGSGAQAPAALGLADLVEGYVVPLMARDAVYGAMMLGCQMGHDQIDELEREFMRTACANVGVALETVSLYVDAQETAEKLKEVDQLKNQFMANMSHELRTPLNSIIGFSRVMLKGIDGPLTDMQETDLGAIYDSGRHLLALINDILDISKINAGKMEVVFEPVDLKPMIQSVMSTAMGFVKDKPIKLLTDVPEDLPQVVADARRIRQVLTNLLGNAGKFTEEGSIKVAAAYDDYQVIVSVQDTGIGIPPERLHAVFEQFEQVDSSSSRRYQGTGLGVPLSREFVRMHGGDMWIQRSVVGEGTTFCFSLPLGGPDAVSGDGGVAVGAQMGPSFAQSAQSRIVLTVDDDAGVITLFRRYLEKQGYKVFGLTRGERVVEEAMRLAPYAITLDVLMPGLDGWGVIEQLKSHPETRDIPIIVCSVLGDEGRGLSMGVTDYLLKPISERALLDALEHVGTDGESGHVLVVDDNPDDRKLLRRILENAGHDVVEAGGGADAISQMQRQAPSLVVLDLMMPDVGGFAVLESLKRDEATRGIPVVVVTAKELSTNERARLQQRVEALLQKGLFDQQQLLSDVTAALDRLTTV